MAAALTYSLTIDVEATLLPWRTEYPDFPLTEVGFHTSITLDSWGNPHISYHDHYFLNLDLKYAWWNGSAWNVETVDSTGDVGHYPSIALDSNDKPHISYYRADTGDLKYAYRTDLGWSRETVLSAGDVGLYSSLALSSLDQPRISYYDADNGDLAYAVRLGPPFGWLTIPVDLGGDVGKYCSLALDSSDYPHISYYRADIGDLKHAWSDGTWHTESIDQVGTVGEYSSIALDSNDYPHISYYDRGAGGRWEDLKYARWNGTDWNEEIVPDPYNWHNGMYSSIALDSNDYPHISQYDDTHDDLWYSWWNGTDWTTDYVTEGVPYDQGEYSSITIDSNDHPHISCFDESFLQPGPPYGALMYTTTAPVNLPPVADADGPYYGTEGVPVTFDGSGSYDLDGTIVSYEWNFGDGNSGSGVNPVYTYAVEGPYTATLTVTDNRRGQDIDTATVIINQGSPWMIQTVDSTENVGMYTSIDLDSAHLPHISYYDLTNTNLKYARYTGLPPWSKATVDSAGNVGWDTSIALDSGDVPHISYFDATNNDLKYANWTGGPAWNTETVDPSGENGWFTSIALDSGDNPHISYSDQDSRALKYARRIGSSWSIVTVDPGGEVGLYSSIALDSLDYPHISYYDIVNYDLKYARWTGSAWTYEPVDGAERVGLYTSIALDSSDDPHISYYDSTNDDLKYARWTGSTWSIKTVDFGVDVGWWTSLALDSLDYPHISYFDNTNDDLKYARWTGSTWSIETVDFAGSVGYFCSLALDAGNIPHISYYDTINGDLKYATLPRIRDVAVIDVTPSKTVVGKGYPMSISVTVEDQTAYSETFDVTVYANANPVGTQTVTLAGGDSTTIPFTWDTTGYAYGTYTISAVAGPVPEETDISDNTLLGGDVLVTVPGDCNGDGIVDIFDIGYISAHWYPGPPIGPLGYHPNADINDDGAVDIFDVGIASAHWGEARTILEAPVISEPTLIPGSSFTIDITISHVEGLFTYQFILSYDTSILTATDVGSHKPFNTHLYSNIDDTAGYVELVYCTYVGDPNGARITGTTPIAWIEFTVDDIGTSALDLYDTILSDPNGDPILHKVVDGFFDNGP